VDENKCNNNCNK